MTTNEIIAMATEAGLNSYRIAPGEAVAAWERFAALVAAREREACAQAAPAAQGDALDAERMRHSANGSRLVRVLYNESPGTLTNTEIGAWIQYAQQLLTTAAQAAPTTQTAPAPAAQLPADGAMRTPEAPQPAVQQGEPVAWRSWDSENSRWNFTLWPDEWAGHADVWEPLYTYPAAPVAHGDALDAARYRWLRGEQQRIASVIDKEYSPGYWEYRSGDELDSAIDAARKQGANHD